VPAGNAGPPAGAHSSALVTGATGLVGSYIVERLLEDGWSVRALSRDPEAARRAIPGGHSVEILRGDVLDEASFRRAARGTNVIFHAAANIIVRGGWESYRVTNVAGTANAIAAAEAAGARLLQVSSVAVYGSRTRYDAAKRGVPTSEEAPLEPLSERAYYARSKRESEAMVLRAHSQGRVWATAVRPVVVYGRRDRQFVPRIGALMRRFPVPLLRGGRSVFGIVHAANVADGAVLAATNDVAGGRAFNLANDFDVSVRRFFELAGDGLGRRPLFIPLPLGMARGGLRAVKTASRLLTGGRLSLVSNSTIDFIAEDNPFTSELARRDLGWKPRVHPEEGVPEAFRWWAQTQTGAT
jgi:nucleoside-diphosphate-sugar epimerase